MTDEAGLQCWRCGAGLAELPQPLSFRAECPDCGADVHVCRMCVFYDPAAADQCREPVAERVRDKTRNNHCDYLKPRPGAFSGGADPAAQPSREALDALFDAGAQRGPEGPGDGVTTTPGTPAGEEDARRRLDELFGKH